MGAKLPTSGPISMDDIRRTFGHDDPVDSIDEYYLNGKFVSDIDANKAIPHIGPISWSDFYGGKGTDAGVLEWGPGTYDVVIPDYGKELKMEMFGGGGAYGATGGDSTFATLRAGGGGAGGVEWEAYGPYQSCGGAGGVAVGGDTGSHNGYIGGMGYIADVDHNGGHNGLNQGAPNYGAGATPPNAYNAGNKWWLRGGGGGGAYVIRTWKAGDPSAPKQGSTVKLIVGAGASGGVGGHAKMSFT